MKGAYFLVLYILKDIETSIGKLGIINFKKGFYIYIGSAMAAYGSTTLENRIKRHISPSKNKNVHWHIDYLLNSESSAVIQLYLIPSSQRLECVIAKELIYKSDSYIGNFGSSDCLCQSHLLFFREWEGINSLSRFYKEKNYKS